MKKLTVLCFVAVMLLASAAFSAPNVQDGQWEITTMMEMPGMPAGMKMQPVKTTTCITQKNAVPEKPAKSDCKMTDSKFAGNTVVWTVTCPNSVSKGKITYSGTAFDGTTDTTVNEGGRTMHMKSRMKGKRIGPCK